MLMGLRAPLKEGQSIRLTLTFEKAGDIEVEVPVGGVAATAGDHSNHTGAARD
jgi:copper(I)-binding protein